MTDTTIRNYQGTVSKGTWYCTKCQYETTNMQQAANHAEQNSSWVYLFVKNHPIAQFEMHPSDYDGVYLNKSSMKTTRQLIERMRATNDHINPSITHPPAPEIHSES